MHMPAYLCKTLGAEDNERDDAHKDGLWSAHAQERHGGHLRPSRGVSHCS